MSEVRGQFSDWEGVRVNVDQLVASSADPFDANMVANAQDLLAVCAKGTPVPTGGAKGYWEAVSFSLGKL